MTQTPAKSNLIATNITNLSASRRAALSSLTVSGDQEDLGGTFEASVCEWQTAYADTLFGLAFLIGDDPVGIVLLKRPPLSPPWVQDGDVSLHGLKIDKSYQGQGLGRAAFGLALGSVGEHWPTASKLVLAVDACNESALAVYRGFGMTDSGPVFRGRVGIEHRLELRLT